MSSSNTESRAIPSNRLRLNAWLVGTAAGAAASAEAATVQIDLIGNTVSYASNSLDDQTYRDLTGDGIDDLVGNGSLSFSTNSGGPGIDGFVAGIRVAAFFTSTISSTYVARIGRNGSSGGNPVSAREFIPVSFTDARINGGALTHGYLEVLARNNSQSSHEIQLVRLVFDDENTDLQEKVSPEISYTPWYDLSVLNQPGPTKAKGNAAKLRLKRQIAALEALIHKVKATAKPNAPRLNFAGMNPATYRYLISLERQLAVLKQRLRRL